VCVCVCVCERERETGPRLAPAAVRPVLQVPLIPANFTQRSLQYLLISLVLTLHLAMF
jgi:hypothetical protein